MGDSTFEKWTGRGKAHEQPESGRQLYPVMRPKVNAAR